MIIKDEINWNAPSESETSAPLNLPQLNYNAIKETLQVLTAARSFQGLFAVFSLAMEMPHVNFFGH